MAEFEVELNVESGRGAYRNFIEGLCVQLRVTFSHNLPVLPFQHNPPTRWFGVVLQTNSVKHSIKLRIRRDNLYVDGYQMFNSTQWWEFGRTSSTSPHLIAGSTFLGFNGDYNALEHAAKKKRNNIDLGQTPLKNAVCKLSTTSTISITHARSLIVVIQMISESIRFTCISNHLLAKFSCSSPPSKCMLALENGWGDLSAALLREDADPKYIFRLPQDNAMNIKSTLDAVTVLGILLRSIRASLSSSSTMALLAAPVVGRPLVEVFTVRINNIDGEDPGQLYGTITVTDGLSSQYIYNQSRDNYESISPRDTVLLTGPTARSISAYGSFTIDVALKDMDKLSPDDDVSSGQISWNVFNTTNEYDKPLYDDIPGRYGSVTVNYVVLSDAVEATVEVTLINRDGENSADVYGLITARNDNFTNESVLFQKISNEHIDVKPGHPIPLSRSVVAVPRNSPLIIRADLMDHDSLSPDDKIAKDTAQFPAQLSGTSQKNISGMYGEIQVKVTWKDTWT
ncbi:hypothetical protein CsSME_00010829 [Camellia sinensis var. sinensis]